PEEAVFAGPDQPGMVPAFGYFLDRDRTGSCALSLIGGGKMQIEKSASQALSWTDFEKLFQPEAGGGGRREVVPRLGFQAAGRTCVGLPDAAGAEDYEDALRRAVERTRQSQERLTQERRDAERLWFLLESHTPARRAILIRNDRRFQTWGLFECL